MRDRWVTDEIDGRLSVGLLRRWEIEKD